MNTEHQVLPNKIESSWREFRNSIKTEIPAVRFSWEDALHIDKQSLKSIPPVHATQQDANA